MPRTIDRREVTDQLLTLARSRDVVGTALGRLQENETAFLHPFGVDTECDEARASLAAHAANRGAFTKVDL